MIEIANLKCFKLCLIALPLLLFVTSGSAKAISIKQPSNRITRAANHRPAPHPIEDAGGRAMLGFYESLARAYRGEAITRIVHYGDSHVAADILTGALRRNLQLCFGDAGAGLVPAGRPWSWYSRAGVTIRASAGWRANGLGEAALAADGRFGLSGISFGANQSGEWISITAAGRYFDIYLLKQPGGGAIDVLLNGDEYQSNISLASPASEADYLKVDADSDSIHTIEIRTTRAGRARMLGIAIERDGAGVVYDALGINGARASRPLLWDWQVLASNIERRDPDLIIIAYGSNEVSDADLDLNDYAANFSTLLNQLHAAAPRASLLVISPPDRAVRVNNRWRTISRMPALVAAQKRAAVKSGAAFYDLLKAMGGSGSIERWATLRQPLAQQDRVHLTQAGYGLIADWLYTELMRSFLRTVLPQRATSGREETDK